ncbi:MAG TPA: hypothetical protein VNO82_06760 [Solirubrobacteraceae bacterium]|nr:hypothetical protein [Solirubrobacteraceae bacterium]
MPGPLEVTVEPWGPDPDRVADVAHKALAQSPTARLVGLRPLDAGDEPVPPQAVRATLYDYDEGQALLVDLPLEGEGPSRVVATARQPLPGADELEAALDVVREDAELGAAVREGRLVPYRSMPPVVEDEQPDGRVERILTVGLRPAEGDDDGHEIVGVRLGRREVVRFEGKAPPTALAGARRCGIADAGQNTVMGRAGAARITVKRDGETLWRLIAVRPAASSGDMGSGVELRGVAYRGKRVLRRAHVPILNVRYGDDACGPYRDWQNEESRFKATGAAVAPGFRLCPQPAETILESRSDQGNFAGVAVYVDGEEVVLVSELAAGWYRYVSRWRLHADGTIKARFGFDAVNNSCVCHTHFHHAYWRLDFDIAGAGDDVVLEHNDPPLAGHDDNWHTLKHEVRRKRNPARKRRWRVRTQGTNEGYVITPGAKDGEADGYGVGDFWALRHRPNQIDDGAVATSTRAALDAFVNGESIVGTNVVVWYVGHFTHETGHDHHAAGGGHIVGPTLKPDRW